MSIRGFLNVLVELSLNLVNRLPRLFFVQLRTHLFIREVRDQKKTEKPKKRTTGEKPLKLPLLNDSKERGRFVFRVTVTCLGVTDTVEVGIELDGLEADLGGLLFVGASLHFVRGQDHVTKRSGESGISDQISHFKRCPHPVH